MMKTRFISSLVVLLGVSEIGSAQNLRNLTAVRLRPPVAARADSKIAPQDDIRVPIMGFLASTSPISIRPILGAPGAVVVGDPIALPENTVQVTVIPGQPYALVERADVTELALLPLHLASAGVAQSIAGTFAHADRVVFSPSTKVAAAYSEAVRQVQVISGVPSIPQLLRQVDLTILGEIPVTSLAVSDDAQFLLVGVADESNGAVWLFANNQPARQVMSLGFPSALHFFAGGSDAVLVDAGWREISLLREVSQQYTSSLLASSVPGLVAPSDVEISNDQQTAWVADPGGAGQLFTLSLKSGTVTALGCPFAPATLVRIGAESVLLVLSQDSNAVGIWAPRSQNPSVWRLISDHQ